jgi:hypothetical protein
MKIINELPRLTDVHIPSVESHNQIILIVTQTEPACLRSHNSGDF